MKYFNRDKVQVLGLTEHEEKYREAADTESKGLRMFERIGNRAKQVGEFIGNQKNKIMESWQSRKNYRQAFQEDNILRLKDTPVTRQKTENATGKSKSQMEIKNPTNEVLAIDNRSDAKTKAIPVSKNSNTETASTIKLNNDSEVPTNKNIVFQTQAETGTRAKNETNPNIAEIKNSQNETPTEIAEISDLLEQILKKLEVLQERSNAVAEKSKIQENQTDLLQKIIQLIKEHFFGQAKQQEGENPHAGTESANKVIDIRTRQPLEQMSETGEQDETKELTGKQAALAVLERHAPNTFKNSEGFVNKLRGESASPADRLLALQIARRAEENLENGGNKSARAQIEQAINYLEASARVKNTWQPPEGKVSDWLEAQSYLNGNTENQSQINALRNVRAEDKQNGSQINTALEAIAQLSKDRKFTQLAGFEAGAALNQLKSELEEKQKRIASETLPQAA